MSVLDKEELPKWQCIKCDLELKIITGEYEAGDRVPSVRSLAKLYKIGTSTAQIILEKMSQDKTLIMEQGIGFKVSAIAKRKLTTDHRERIRGEIKEICKYCNKLKLDPIEIAKEFYTKEP